ncbi:MAG: diguanylate cyclase domain-containing protein [Myxococcaceae bacterium]
MSRENTDDQAESLLRLYPFARSQPNPLAHALQTLIEEERMRRGTPEPLTGAYSRIALTQGSILNGEFDLSTMGHWESWPIGAVIVDLKETILLNQRYGFQITDGALRAIGEALRARFRSGKLVRMHGDCFAVLLPPSSEVPMSESYATEIPALLTKAVLASLPDDGEPPPGIAFTPALLQLRIVNPPNAAILGPLVYAECERAYVLQRTGGATGIQERRVDLQGSVQVPAGR